MHLLKMNLKNYRHLTQVFLLVKAHFFNDGAQLYLIFQPLYHTLKRLGDNQKVISWKSKALLIETFITPTAIDNTAILHQLVGMKILIFVYHLKEDA